ncbi:MAG TPA: TetR/AcrR family transcriptional regulator [Mycobacteriales bacterium]|nr:TetR/AcrR family transcriptional regulator [Mycobacteriales bacterium]
MAPRTGRRPGDSGTREAILAAARESFGTAGFAGTTIRGVAGAAGVDPALVHHYFGSKQQLFAACLELPVDPEVLLPQLLAGGPDDVGQRVVRTFVGVWDAVPGQGPMLALLRSAVSDPRAADSLRDFLTGVVLGPLAAAAAPDRADLRAALMASQMVGLAVTRYVVHLEPVASASAGELASAIGPTLQRYLTGEL